MPRHSMRDALLAFYARSAEASFPNTTNNEVMLVRPDHLGDMLFLIPAVRRFHLSLEGWKITLVVGPWASEIARRSPDVDEVLQFPFPGFTRRPKRTSVEPYQALKGWAEELRQRQPAAVIVLREDHWWAATAAQIAGVPLRFGADHDSVQRFLTHRTRVTGHAVERNSQILDSAARLLGGKTPVGAIDPVTNPLRWSITDSERAAATERIESLGIHRPFLLVHPGSGAAVKLWSATRWAATLSRVSQQLGLDIVLVGGPAESGLIQEIATRASVDVALLAPDLTLGVLAAVMAQARIVAGVDSGPLHLAVATGVTTLQIYGPSNIQQYGPWGDPARHQVISAAWNCTRCGDLSPARPTGCGCMLAIDTSTVVDRLCEMMSRDES